MSNSKIQVAGSGWLKTEPPAVQTRSLVTPFAYFNFSSSSDFARVLLSTPPTVFRNDEGGVEYQWDKNDTSINLQIDKTRKHGVFHLYHDKTKNSEFIEFGIRDTQKIDLIISKIVTALRS